MKKTDQEKSLKAVIGERPLVQGDEKILVLGANGQVASYLVPKLEKYYGDSLILTDTNLTDKNGKTKENLQFLNVTDADAIEKIVKENNVKVIINLAAKLSGAAAEAADKGADVNIEAPKNIFRIAEKYGVRKVFIPSSIAVMGEGAAIKGEKAQLNSVRNPISDYGKAKKIIEDLATSYSQGETGVQGLCLRYGGVLACHVPPSNGTTEELDRLIVAAAEYVAKQGKNLEHSNHGIYHPKIPGDILFPMVDGESAAIETMRYLHADPEKIKGKEASYYLAEYRASVNAVNNIIKNKLIPDSIKMKLLPEDLRDGFQVVDDPSQYDQNKVSFAETWPEELEMKQAKEDWKFEHGDGFARCVRDHFYRLVEEFKEQAKPKAPQAESEESARRGIAPSNGHVNSHTSPVLKPGIISRR